MKYNNKLILIVIFICSVIYNFPIIKMPLNTYDEGIILSGAERILKGDLPYIDFWTIYPPGQFYMLAFLFKLFGSSVLIERIYDIIIKSLLSLFGFVIVKKFSLSYKTPLITWLMLCIWIYFSGFPAYPVYPALLFMFVSIYFFIYYVETNQVYWIIYSSIFIVLGGIFRHDLSILAAIAFLITLFIRKIKDKQMPKFTIFFYIFTIFCASIPFLIYIIKYIGIQPVINQLFFIPAEIMPKYRWLPYPISIYNIQFLFFPSVIIIAFFVSSILIKKYNSYKESYILFLLSLIGLLFFNQARVRSDNIHLLPIALMSITIIPALTSSMTLFLSLNKSKQKFVKFVIFVIFMGIGLVLMKPVYKKINSFKEEYLAIPRKSIIDKAGYADMSKNLQDLIIYIRKNTTTNEAIYVGVKNHDRFIINDVIIYFLANRNYSTKYHELHPGITNKAEIQKEIINEIRSVKIIILAPGYWYEPNYTKFDFKVDLLDNYISENFRLTKRFGKYEVWHKRTPKN